MLPGLAAAGNESTAERPFPLARILAHTALVMTGMGRRQMLKHWMIGFALAAG
jgi:hypothetical protein